MMQIALFQFLICWCTHMPPYNDADRFVSVLDLLVYTYVTIPCLMDFDDSFSDPNSDNSIELKSEILAEVRYSHLLYYYILTVLCVVSIYDEDTCICTYCCIINKCDKCFSCITLRCNIE